MARLLRSVLLLLPERRLVNEQIRPLRRVYDGRRGTGIAREHDASSLTLLPYDSLRYDFPAAMVRCKHVNIVLFPLPPSPAFYRISRLHFQIGRASCRERV